MGAAFADALQAWLDGSTRRHDAERLLAECKPLSAAAQQARLRALTLREQAVATLAPVPTWAPVAEKAAGWRLHTEADGAEAEARQLTLDLELRLAEVMRRAPLPEARLKLGALLRDRLLDAEARGDTRLVAELETRLLRLDADRHAAFVEGLGQITITTEPPGAQVIDCPEVEQGRRLVSTQAISLGVTPLTAQLPRGSHRLRLVAPGCVPVELPVRIDRDTPWDHAPPDAHGAEPLWLPRQGALREGECYVPAGWFRSGGDPQAADALPARRIWVDGFAIERTPLTYGRLLRALNALVEAGRADDADRLAPPPFDATGRGNDGHVGVCRDADGRYRLAAAGAVERPEDWPVTQLDWHAATAWAALRHAQTGLPWRLPHELEWEKAARGVDGRPLPWGHHFEPTWSCNAQARDGAPTRAPVDAFFYDQSPYGVLGMAGNVRDWCLNRFHAALPAEGERLVVTPDDRADGPRTVRGGAYGATPVLCHPAARYGAAPDGRYFFVGVRLVRPLP